MAESGTKKTVHSTGFLTLKEWNDKAHAFVLEVYKVTNAFPKSEMFGLISQFRRASVSIAANIAEGFRKTVAGRENKIPQYRAGVD